MIYYDSGWWPAASGAINAGIHTDNMDAARLIIAASGANAASSATCGWSAGAATPIPWTKNTPSNSTSPLITGALTVAPPAANSSNVYYIGFGFVSGTALLSPWMPSVLNVSVLASASSWARVILEGK